MPQGSPICCKTFVLPHCNYSTVTVYTHTEQFQEDHRSVVSNIIEAFFFFLFLLSHISCQLIAWYISLFASSSVQQSPSGM